MLALSCERTSACLNSEMAFSRQILRVQSYVGRVDSAYIRVWDYSGDC